MAIEKQISWKEALQSKKFRSLFLFGAIGMLINISIWPVFLGTIEKRNGILLHDAVLALLPATDLSIPIFTLLWAVTILMIVRMVQQPKLFLMFLFSYWFLFLARMVTIYLTPLNPPLVLIKLKDPISNMFYGQGGGFITKDLFFSGHTASLFLMFLFLKNKWERRLALLASVAVGTMVLFQHIHYSIDVLFAPPFAFAIYWIVKRWLDNIYYVAHPIKELKRKTLVD